MSKVPEFEVARPAVGEVLQYSRGAWRNSTQSLPVGSVSAYSGYINVTDAPYNARCDGVTDDTAAIQAAVDAIASGGVGIIYVPRLAKISATILAADKQAIAFVGPASSNMLRPASLIGPSAGFIAATGWGATTPLIKVTSSSVLSENGGACTLDNFALVPNVAGNGWGLLLEKNTGTAKNVFIGNVSIFNSTICYFAKGIAIDDSANHSFSAPTANGNGFGWLTVRNSRLTGNTFGIHANCAINVVNIAENVFAHCAGSANGNYKTRTGGAVVLKNGISFNITGNDFEDSQVGLQTGAAFNVNIKGNYFEANPDAAIALVGARDVSIEGNYGPFNASYRSDQVYCESCRNVTLRGNNRYSTQGMYLVLADKNRDIVTDTPHLTKFYSGSDGSQTIDNSGLVIQSLATALRQPEVAATHLLTSAALNNATQAEITGPTPLGFQNRGAAITATSANGTLKAVWNTVPVLAGQWLVTSCAYRMDSTVGANPMTLVVEENKGLGGGLLVAYGSTIDTTMLDHGEDVVLQWHHKVDTGEAANFSTQFWPEIPTINDVAKIYGLSQVLSDIPFVRPQSWEVISSGGTERYLTADGRIFYGANAAASPPAATTLTWKVGDLVWRNSPAAGETPGWYCTTAGAGGTAVFTALVGTYALSADIQSFVANGTWTKPAGAKTVRVIGMGAGGGGGGGARTASGNASSGGGGGGGALLIDQTFAAASLGATVAVTVGTGGTAGAGATVDANAGGNGGAGGNSSFGSIPIAYGGGGGAGGQLAGASGGGGGAGYQGAGSSTTSVTAGAAGSVGGSAGGSGSTGGSNTAGAGSGGGGGANGAAGPAGGAGSISPLGGGAGGGVSTTPGQFAGGVGNGNISVSAVAGGTAGGTAGTAGGTPTSYFGGGGGAGGGSNITGVGGAGGLGKQGGGGGGGGSAVGGNGGAGGVGGTGLVTVITYF